MQHSTLSLSPSLLFRSLTCSPVGLCAVAEPEGGVRLAGRGSDNPEGTLALVGAAGMDLYLKQHVHTLLHMLQVSYIPCGSVGL